MKMALIQLPEASNEDLEKYAVLFCSDPTLYDPKNPQTWPVHITGGAIDLTMRSLDDKQEAFMGGIFDDADQISFTAYYEASDLTSQSALEARYNRRLLYHAMHICGFQNKPEEWWHFDYGTQMWIANGNLSGKALYGRAELLPD
jgi:D-alanyl-D-alanine dipeptidase